MSQIEPQNKPRISSEENHTNATDDFQQIENQFLYPTSANEKFDVLLDKIRRISVMEKIFFTQNLGVMFKSGLPASRALRTLALQTTDRKFKRILLKIYRNVEKGETIANSMEPYPNVFPSIFVNMIRAGESSGQLESVLIELTRQMKKNHELTMKVKGALMYPTAILATMITIGTAMVIFVIPKLTAVFTEMQTELPLPTKILISVTDWINSNLAIAGGLAIFTIGGLIYFSKTTKGKKIWHWMILSLPVIKKISHKINLAKISRTLGSMIKTDMPIVESLKLTSSIVNNVHYKNSIMEFSKNVEKGKTISSEMSVYPKLYPPIVQQMVSVGEETGEISEILSQLADFYEEEVSQTMDSLPSLIEPVLIIIMGVVIGGMAVAIIMPMYSLSQSI
jgi:type IV pilus assembly protein PilC